MFGLMNGKEKRNIFLTRMTLVFICLIISRLLSGQGSYNLPDDKPGKIISRWTFDNDEPGYACDNVSNTRDSLYGNFEYVTGIKGKGIKLDGFRTYIKRRGRVFEEIPDSFTIEAWIAPASYPWSWCPVLDCSDNKIRGFFFGIDQLGRVAFRVPGVNRWYEAVSDKVIPLRKWSHIAAVYRADNDISVYINGENVASDPISGRYLPSQAVPTTIGRNNKLQVWNEYQLTNPGIYFFLDAILDEISITARAKDSREIREYLAYHQNIPEPELSRRDSFPVGPRGSGSFGAFYERLDYFNEWDEMWRVGDKPDVFVRFEDSPVQLVFWRGTSFVPCWVSENDIWYTNEWLETWGRDVVSCAEPIMDRHCRYSHVRIIENTDARVIVHWRYALADAFYDFAAITDDGRGEWCDEYHIIYPDNVGIRKMDLHYSKPERKHDWVEQIILTQPGIYPDDIIERDAITLVNMKGETKDYSWHDDIKVEMPEPEGANISYVNLKSQYKPFFILSDGPVKTVEGKWDSPFFRSYAAKMAIFYRPDPVPSVYGWWNHWPVAQVPGDGRWILKPDRPGHFNLTTFVQWNDLSKTDRTRTRIMLQGMTDRKAPELLDLARSWLNAPEISIISGGYENAMYDQTQRAYVIEKRSGKEALELLIGASKKSPLVNPAIIIKDWGREEAKVSVNGKHINSSSDLRQGIVSNPYGSDLILWLRINTEKKLRIDIGY